MKKGTMFKLVQTAGLVQRKFDAELEKKGLSMIRWQLLNILDLAGDAGVIPSVMAEETDKVRHDITGIVARMIRDGLVKTKPSVEDRRSTIIIITEKGKRVLQDGTIVLDSLNEKFAGKLNDKAVLRYLDLLNLKLKK